MGFLIELINLIHIVIIITSPRVDRILFLYLMHGVYSHLICFVPQFYRLSLSLLM